MIEFLQNASIYWLLCIVFFDWDMILRLRDLLASFYLYGRNLKNGRKQLKQLQREQRRKECVTMRYLFSHLKGQEALFARWRRFYIAYLWRVGGSYLAIGACLLFSHRAAAMLLGCIAVILDELLTTYVRFLYKGGFITGVCKYAIKESQYKRRH